MAQMKPKMDGYVFISSSSRDKELTSNLVRLLNENGIRTWSDIAGEGLPGSNWENQIDASLRNSTVVLSLATENFLSSEWFHSQANLALGLGKPLIPVVQDGLRISELPKWTQKLQVVRFPSERKKLIRAILIIFDKVPNSKNKTDVKLEKSTKQSKKKATKKQVANPSQNSQPTVSTSSLNEDKTPFHKDTPSLDDYLGRKGFVEALAQWTDRYWTEYQTTDKSFVINIHGQWGAGKTTFLNLLQKELQENSQNEWIVVWFNAWENRHFKPVWWPLMDRIYRDSITQLEKLGVKTDEIKSQESWWRFYAGRKWELIGFLASFVILFVVLILVVYSGGFRTQNDMEGVVNLISALLAVASTIFIGSRFISQTLSFESAKAAEAYLQFTADPVENIKRHFDDLIEKKINKPVIVFIDDLDRCDREYLVNLLESIQTLLNHRKVFYVIAADQRWLFAAFEENYKEFKDSIKEPGKKIGYLFLEKIFQLSMSIPQISDEARKVYLDHLLGKSQQIEVRREQLKQELASIDTEQDLISKVQAQDSGTIDKVLMREVAVAKSASIEIEKETTHFLSNFAHLMEPNPRAIKRLVTFYGVLRAIAILSDEEIISDQMKRNQLVLWTITRMRWPLLADYLEEYPQYLENFKTGKPTKAIHVDLVDLIKNQEVMDVLKGKGINTDLDADALKRFTSLKATERTF